MGVGVVVDHNFVVAPVGCVELVTRSVERAAGGRTAQRAGDGLLEGAGVVVDVVGPLGDSDEYIARVPCGCCGGRRPHTEQQHHQC